MGNDPRFTELKRLTAESGDPTITAFALGFAWGFLDLAQQERTIAAVRDEIERIQKLESKPQKTCMVCGVPSAGNVCRDCAGSQMQ